MLFVDVCKAGTIGTIQNTTVAPTSSSWAISRAICSACWPAVRAKFRSKGREFGGGHGVFSYSS